MFRNSPGGLIFSATLMLLSVDLISALGQPPRTAKVIRRIQFGSCTQQNRPVPIYRTMLGDQPDLLLFLGDNIYADTPDREVMRAKYETLAANPDFRELRAACPVLATWDDHDYGKNDAGADFPSRETAKEEFLRFWNEPADSPRRQRDGIYDARLFGPEGKRVQVILLDTRFFRSPLKTGPRRVGGPYVSDEDPEKTMLGETQWNWLERQLRVPAELRVIASSIQFVAESSGQETWSNLPRERLRLIELIQATGADGVIIVSGDRHWAELSAITDGVDYPLYDMTSSSFNQVHSRGTPTENRFRVIDKTYHRENYGLIAIDWEAADPAITISIRDLEGRVQLEKELRLHSLQSKPPTTPAK